MSEALEQRMQQFQDCIEQRDRALAENVLDEDYALVLVQPTRAVMPRERWLELLPDYQIRSYAIEERIIDVDGDCASALQRVHMEASFLGEDRSGAFIISDIWRLRDGIWRVWRRHSSPLSAGVLPGAR